VTGDGALYRREDDAFVGTGCTRGSWHANGQSGGAVLALLGHVLEDVATIVPMSISRLTADLVRPVPVGEPLWVDTHVVREGKRIQVADLVVRSREAECVRGRVLRIRDDDVRAGPPLPQAGGAGSGPPDLPRPEDLDGVDHLPGVADFLRLGAELRRTTEPGPDGSFCVWVRLRVPVVAGEAVRAGSRTALPMDCVNLIGVHDLAGVRAVNPDVSAHVARPPEGEWTALLGTTRFAPEVGHGVSVAHLADRRGIFGVTSTSQVVER
jgi:hypothetical protein